MTYAIQTHALTKQYANTLSVDQLSLNIKEGSVYGFIGPNGAGKSTTMKMLLGLIRPTSGEIQLYNKPLTDRNRLSLLQQTGSLIESPSYYGHLTAQENLEIIAALKNVDTNEIAHVLETVHLAQDKNRKVKEYSLGMKQRLGIAQALLGHPRLLLLDEPTNGLDPAGIQEIRELISELPKTHGMTILISSHLLGELDQMITDVGIISHGKLLYENSLEALHRLSHASLHIKLLNLEKGFNLLNSKKVSCSRQGSEIILPHQNDIETAAIIRLLAEADTGILRVEEENKTLEQLFLEMTESREVTLCSH